MHLPTRSFASLLLILAPSLQAQFNGDTQLGREVAIPHHLQDGDEFKLSPVELAEFGRMLFTAVWTDQEGCGRPLTKGTGAVLADPTQPLVFPRAFNRLSGPDSNSCAGCHNQPFGIPGGGGDVVSNVFVLGQRFDFMTFDHGDPQPTRGSVDELGRTVSLQTVADSRATIGMFGSGFIEMLARQITRDLQAIRDATPPGQGRPLVSKGISYGTVLRRADGTWDVSQVAGLSAPSLATDAATPPSLIIRPFHQAGRVISLREFTNNAFNQHHGMQSTERFGRDTDPDGDGVANELTRADVTAAVVYQATMAVPGRVIPRIPAIERAVLTGERRFQAIGCATCHVPALPLDRDGWVFREPNPYNPPTNLRVGDAPTLAVDLTDDRLPPPRLAPDKKTGVLLVPAYTDFKLHDLCDGPGDPNIEPLDMNEPNGSAGFFAGNRKFLTARLWGAANEPPFFHHGQFTTLRQAILAHGGEAAATRRAFLDQTAGEQNSIIEFLKTLQVLPPGTRSPVCDENYHPRPWPPP